jgi:polygalacturonase
LRDTIDLKDWGVIFDARGTAGTDNSRAVQLAVDSVSLAGGGTIHISAPLNGRCANLQNIVIQSNITFEGDGPASCTLKPSNGGSGGAVQMFTTNNGVGGPLATPVSNVHFRNFTIDGNAPNQTGLPGSQNGMFGIYLGGCSNCSIEGMVIQNHYTDGVDIDGYGTQTLTGTANTVVSTINITGVTWSAVTGLATYTTASATGLIPGAPVIVASVNPTAYNFTSAVARSRLTRRQASAGLACKT